jgi:hypothetical protein
MRWLGCVDMPAETKATADPSGVPEDRATVGMTVWASDAGLKPRPSGLSVRRAPGMGKTRGSQPSEMASRHDSLFEGLRRFCFGTALLWCCHAIAANRRALPENPTRGRNGVQQA